MRLQNKLLIGFSIVIFLLIVRGIQGGGFADLLRNDAERLADQITPSLGLLQDIEIHKARIIEEAFSGSAQLVLGNTEQAASEAEEMEESRSLLKEAVTAFSAMPHHAEIADEIAEFNRLSDEMYAAAMVMLEPVDRDSVLEALETLETTSEGLTALLDQWLEHETGELNDASTTIVRVARQVFVGGNVSSVLLVIVVAITGFVFYRTVVRPMTLLEETARHIAGGDYTHRVKVTQQDEIGKVMQAFNTMAASVEKRDGQLNSLNQELNTRFEEAQTARERAERSDRVKSAFLASMSHELRTPLNSILNFTKFIMKGVMGPVTDRQTDSLTKILNASKHLLNLINDVLDMSKIESDSLTLFVEDDVNIRELLNMAVETAQGLLEDKPIEIKQTVPAELPLIRGDKQRILQILLNILSNACKFTEQGAIDIRVENENNELHIAIKDSGVGIAPEDLALVFEPFKQTDSGLRQGGGTGLGMPISRSLAEAHQGKLWLESTPGAGTTVHVTLPVRSEALTPIEA